MAESLHVDTNHRESSLSPSPTLSSSPQSNSGSGYEGSLDSSPSSDRVGRQKTYPPHSPGPGLPRGSGTESSSSGDELNISTAPPMDFDENHKDVDSLLSSEMKPLSEQMEVTHPGATQLVANMPRLSLQEEDQGLNECTRCRRLEIENKQLKTENRSLLDTNKQLQEELKKLSRPPLVPMNGQENIPQKKPARERPHGRDQQLYYQQEN